MRRRMNLQFLYLRGETWWYNRRVPSKYAHLDTRNRIRISLKTDSKEKACAQRDELVKADEAYWISLLAVEQNSSTFTNEQVAALEKRYLDAKRRALEVGFDYLPIEILANQRPFAEVYDRLKIVERRSSNDGVPRASDAEALLGGAGVPKVTVSQALEIYFDEIAVDEQLYKSENQRYQWRKVKKRSIAYFIDQSGDKPLVDIDRDDAIRYKRYWIQRMSPSQSNPVSASTANRHIGNIRALFRAYFKHLGEESRENPFRNLNFAVKIKTEVPAFEPDWIQTKILRPGIFAGLRAELQLIAFSLIETGCRPSEIINLQPEDIVLHTDVPHILIKARSHGKGKREIKTVSSERELPLVGVSLEAMKRAEGRAFSHYQDRNELFSSNLMQAFRRRGLFPTKAHKIYSLRHSFEKRMQEANLDYGLRCLLMGHKTDRPAYGDGGSLEYRRDELMKICLDFDPKVFDLFDAEHEDWCLTN